MPQKGEVAAFEGRVGDLVLEYEHEYLSSYDRTIRVCPWLARADYESFFAMRPFQKDARTVVAREEGYEDWSSLCDAHDLDDPPLWRELHRNELTALGLSDEFSFGGAESDFGMLERCIRWICLTRNFGAVPELCREAGARLSSSTPTLTTLLVEADAPLEAVERSMALGRPHDFQKAARSAFHRANQPVLDLLAKSASLPPFQPIDHLLRFCCEGNASKVQELVRADPLLWHRNASLIWWTASSWSECGAALALETARRAGLHHPKEPANWRTPLHGSAWKGDKRALLAALDMDCPVNMLDQRNLSSPMGWLVRSVILLPLDQNPFYTPEKAECVKLLAERGAVIMPGYLNRHSRDLLKGAIN